MIGAWCSDLSNASCLETSGLSASQFCVGIRNDGYTRRGVMKLDDIDTLRIHTGFFCMVL